MTDKKFTDKEIIDSLSNCALAHHNPDFCKECHYKDLGHVTCTAFITNDAIDLINRQKSEIESLKKTEIEIDDFCRRLCRMRMLNGSAIASYQDLQNYIQQEKAEAYKEFAEKLKAAAMSCLMGGKYYKIITTRCIDMLLKEMVGEE